MGNIAISDELRNAFENKGIEYYELREASPQEFYDAIGNAKKVNEHGAFVTQHSIEEYASMKKLFVTSDGKAGIAITEDNNIVSIFRNCYKIICTFRLVFHDSYCVEKTCRASARLRFFAL